LPQPETLLEGKYEILKKLREGGMGTIYCVRHRLLDEIRAIKVMRAHVIADADLKSRFVEEAKTATRLKHPNICTIHDFALGDDGMAYLVMEFIDGVNLADLLRSEGPPHPSLTLEIAHQALLALAYLHRKGVVHRDVAPDNLMLTHDAEDRTLIKLIDLGIAKTDRGASETAAGVFLGKLKYASPEQFGTLAPGERLDGRSDLYGLGVVLYELLTGVRPFVGETPAELLRSHLFNPPLPFSESDPQGKVPQELRTVILKAIERKREDRYATAEDFDRDILALKDRFSPAREQEDTRAMLARIPTPPPMSDGVTPSAQNRLDRQFASATPRPSRELTVVPDAARPLPQINLVNLVASKPDAPFSTKAPTRPLAIPTAPPPEPLRLEPVPIKPPPTRGRRAAALAVLAIVLVAAAFLLLRPRPSTPAASPAPAAVPSPEPPPRESPAPQPTAILAAPLEAEAAKPAEVAAAPTVVRPTAPNPENPRLRQAMESARAHAARARSAAERARGPELAAESYNRGRAMETDAILLVARNRAADATDAFDLAARFFAESETAARKPLPSPEAAAARAAPSPRPEPTAAPAIVPEREVVAPPPPAPPTRAGPSEQDRIRETVALYEKAQSALDSDLYSRIYPSVDRARIDAAFRSFASQSVVFEVRRIQVEPGGARAAVYGFEKRVAVPRAGSEQHLSGERVMHLRKQGDAWVITGLD
jgi:serine/threonine protein kinase